MKLIPIAILLIAFAGCSSTNSTMDSISPATPTYQITNDLSYNDLLLRIGQAKLARAVEQPNAEGALGRNKDGYFHVRFQINMTSISDYAIAAESVDAVQYLLNTIAYSFDQQIADGSFEFSPPEELVNSPSYHPPATGDLESGTAFFASSLGLSLLSLQNSNWFLSSQETQSARAALESLKPSFEKTLDYLIHSRAILSQYDAHAPNRLLFDALAYYSLGTYLSRPDAQQVGLEFIEAALSLIDTVDGYFIEGGGWDSSYNGVAIKLAMELFSLLDNPDQKDDLREAINSATNWQISRIKEN